MRTGHYTRSFISNTVTSGLIFREIYIILEIIIRSPYNYAMKI